MADNLNLPGWGHAARRAFRNVFSPMIGVCLLLNLLTAEFRSGLDQPR